jgi:molybdopterin-containing oxidoreductase family membrane subunit
MFVLSIFVNIGMWFERFVIIASSLHRDFLPSSWGYFRPTAVDMLTFFGTFGLFLTLFLLFCRFLPVIALSEVKGMMANESMHTAVHGTAYGPAPHDPGFHEVFEPEQAPTVETGGRK